MTLQIPQLHREYAHMQDNNCVERGLSIRARHCSEDENPHSDIAMKSIGSRGNT